MTERQVCPECGGEMSFRLGMFECAQCGHTEAPQADPPEEAPAGRFGQGRAAWQADHPLRARPRAVSAAEAKQDLDYDPDAAPPRVRLSGLELEKRVYFGITAVVTVAGSLSSIVVTLAQGGGFGWLAQDLFLDAAALFLLAYVLFAGENWAKGCCAALVVLNLLAMIGTAYVAIPFINAALGYEWLLPAFITLPFWGDVAVYAVWYGWLLTILRRDYVRG